MVFALFYSAVGFCENSNTEPEVIKPEEEKQTPEKNKIDMDFLKDFSPEVIAEATNKAEQEVAERAVRGSAADLEKTLSPGEDFNQVIDALIKKAHEESSREANGAINDAVKAEIAKFEEPEAKQETKPVGATINKSTTGEELGTERLVEHSLEDLEKDNAKNKFKKAYKALIKPGYDAEVKKVVAEEKERIKKAIDEQKKAEEAAAAEKARFDALPMLEKHYENIDAFVAMARANYDKGIALLEEALKKCKDKDKPPAVPVMGEEVIEVDEFRDFKTKKSSPEPVITTLEPDKQPVQILVAGGFGVGLNPFAVNGGNGLLVNLAAVGAAVVPPGGAFGPFVLAGGALVGALVGTASLNLTITGSCITSAAFVAPANSLPGLSLFTTGPPFIEIGFSVGGFSVVGAPSTVAGSFSKTILYSGDTVATVTGTVSFSGIIGEVTGLIITNIAAGC